MTDWVNILRGLIVKRDAAQQALDDAQAELDAARAEARKYYESIARRNER